MRWCVLFGSVANALAILFLVSVVLYLRNYTLPKCVFCCARLLNARARSIDGTLELPGLLAAVDVERDVNGIIHIRAQNDHDVYYAQGAVAAQERMFQMEFQRMLGAGRLSEHIGNSTIHLDRVRGGKEGV